MRRNTARDAPRIVFRLFLRAAAIVSSVQVALVAVLMAIDAMRRRRSKPAGGFPRSDYSPIDLKESDDQAKLYSYGDAVYADMLADIERAEHTIMVESFIWKDDDVGKRFVQALERKARQGVKVYAIFDEFANLVVPAEFKRFPDTIHTLRFRPLPTPLSLLDYRTYFRDHRKLLIVDAAVGYVGGFNIGDLYASGSWRDTHLRIEGGEARELENAFVDFWNDYRGSNLPELVQDPGRNWRPTTTLHRNDSSLRVFPIRNVYLEAIDRAERHIYITQAYFVPDKALRAALKDAAGRGVDVQVLLPWHSNHVVADWLGRRWFGDLLNSGVRIFRYRDIMIHSKTATIDSVWSTIGTANIDRFSLFGNFEVNMEVYDAAMAGQMEQMFALDKTNASELTREEWMRRPIAAKVTERILESLAPVV
ncbi:phospholipase D-like domain-containing protein [Arthrobacter pigmenti]